MRTPSPVSSPTERLNTGRGGHTPSMLTILLIVLIVLLLFGGGGYYYRGRSRL